MSPGLKRRMEPCLDVPASVEVPDKNAGAGGTGEMARASIRQKRMKERVRIINQSGPIQEEAFDLRMERPVVQGRGNRYVC